MNVGIRSRRNRAYETSYRREFVSKSASPIVGGIPLSRRFLIGSPFQLSDPIGNSLYMMDFDNQRNVCKEPFFRPNTSRANRPHPHQQCPHWPQRSVSATDLRPEETEQALRNQLDSTSRVDYIGTPEGFPVQFAYDRTRPFWREQAQHTLDSEYRHMYQIHPKKALFTGGRYACHHRAPAAAVVPQTLPIWRKKKNQLLRSIYGHEISQKPPSDLYMRTLVDSLGGPMNS